MSDIRVIRRGGKVIGTAVYVGRPSVLGNPFTHRADASAIVRVASREEAISPVDFERASHPSPRCGSAADWVADALPILARTLDSNRARSV